MFVVLGVGFENSRCVAAQVDVASAPCGPCLRLSLEMGCRSNKESNQNNYMPHLYAQFLTCSIVLCVHSTDK